MRATLKLHRQTLEVCESVFSTPKDPLQRVTVAVTARGLGWKSAVSRESAIVLRGPGPIPDGKIPGLFREAVAATYGVPASDIDAEWTDEEPVL